MMTDMDIQYRAIPVVRKIGDEKFSVRCFNLDLNLLDFWKWSCSDLTGNTARGILAEYLVAKALGIDDDIRFDWQEFDLEIKDKLKIEVKSSAYLQSWKQKEESRISFGIQKSRKWDTETGELVGEPRRHANIYVFCILACKSPNSINPMNLD
jgi:hypothetical protein